MQRRWETILSSAETEAPEIKEQAKNAASFRESSVSPDAAT